MGVRTYAFFGRLRDIRQRIRELEIGRKINTSHLERLNGTIRGQQTRLARRRGMEKGDLECGVGGDGDTEAPVPAGFPVLPCNAPSLPQTWADWEAQYTSTDQPKQTDVTLHVGEALDRYRIASADYDELEVTTRSEIRTSEPGSWLTREFNHDYNLQEGWFRRTGPDGVEPFVRVEIANRVEFVRRGPESAPLMTATYT